MFKYMPLGQFSVFNVETIAEEVFVASQSRNNPNVFSKESHPNNDKSYMEIWKSGYKMWS